MSTIKISELATSNIALTDFFAKADATGSASKNTVQELSNLLKTVDDTAFKGSIAIADIPSENGWYFASESGTYTNCGGLVIDTADNIAIIIVSGTFDTFNKIDIPVNITIDAVPTLESTNAVESGGVKTALLETEVVTSKMGKFYAESNLLGNSFEVGSILSGVDSSSTLRIRSVGFIELENSYDVLNIGFLNDLFEVYIVYYDASYNFINQSVYLSENASITPYVNTKYIRTVFKYGSAGSQVLTTSFINKIGISLLYQKYFNKDVSNYLKTREYNIEVNVKNGINKSTINTNSIYTNNTINGSGVVTANGIRLLSDLIPVVPNSRYLRSQKNNLFEHTIHRYDLDGVFIDGLGASLTPFTTNSCYFIRIKTRKLTDARVIPTDAIYAGIEIIRDTNYNFTGSYVPSNEIYWEQGTISGGASYNLNYRLRTDYIPVVGGNYYLINNPATNYELAVNTYDEDKNYTGLPSQYPPSDAVIWVEANGFIRFVTKLRNPSPETQEMFPSMMNGLAITMRVNNNWFSGVEATDSDIIKLNVMSNNVGIFNEGVAPVGIPPAGLAQGIIDWKSLISENEQDIVFLQEVPNFVDDALTLDTYTTLYKEIYPYYAQLNNFTGIASKIPFISIFKTTTTNRNWIASEITVNKTEIGIASVHLLAGATAGNIATRGTEASEIIAHFSNNEFVIIGADLNTQNDTELDVWRNAGYKLANWGYFGELDTLIGGKYDNIMVKGGNISTTKVSPLIATSDHYPIYSKISFGKKN